MPSHSGRSPRLEKIGWHYLCFRQSLLNSPRDKQLIEARLKRITHAGKLPGARY